MKKSLYKKYLKCMWEKNKINYILSIITIIFSTIISISVAFFLEKLINIAYNGTLSEMYKLIISAGILIGISAVISLLQKKFQLTFYYTAICNYKNYAFSKMLNRNAYAFNKETTGTYLSALSNDIYSIENNYIGSILTIIGGAVSLIGAICSMIYLNWMIFCAVIVALSIPMIISLIFTKSIAKQEKVVSDENGAFISNIQDILIGFPIVKSFNAEKEIEALFLKKNRMLELAKKKQRYVLTNVSILLNLTSLFVVLIVFVVGGYLSIQGLTTPGVVIAFIQLLNYVNGPIQSIPPSISRITASKKLIEKLANGIENDNNNGIKDKEVIFNKCIEFKNTTFGYDDKKKILNSLNLKIEKGKNYAIVGTSGSGKSTLINLIMGYYDDYEGEILVDEQELKYVNAKSLRNIMSMIQQNVFIFNADIYSNITMYKKFDEKAVSLAIEKAGLNDLLKEKGNNYLCGENGCNLSGGERQRICIARTLLRNTPLLLMDEGTSSLDNNTSVAIEEAILSITGLTRIVVTHKLNDALLRKYDEILVLKNGVIAEHGTFNELKEKGKYFKAMYEIETELQ